MLSQKPFVEDLDEGDRLCDLADRCERVLAVNQNGRWAPHFSYARQAVATGVIGAVTGVHMSVHWDHSWIKGTAFEQVKHLILYDYAIHWFDMVACLFADRRITRVSASTSRAVGQDVEPHLLGQALIECSDGQASLAFDGFTPQGTEDRTFIAGSSGSISSIGPGNKEQTLTVSTADWTYQPALQGCWFPDGFRGTMGELQASLLTGRPPSINARDNLRSLELCFAAVASAELGRPVNVGDVRRLPA